jgi:peptidyl-Lys metalloendopeptidase
LLLALAACAPDQPAITDVAGTAAPATRGAPNGLEVKVALPSEIRGNAPVTAQVTLTNRAAYAIDVPESQLPSEDMETAQFIVRRDGQPVGYEGPHIKRGLSWSDAIIRVEPGASYTYDIELSRAYDLSRDGRYTVTFASRSGASAATVLQSATQEVRVAGRTAPVTSGILPRTPASLTSLVSYSRCTATQQTDVLAALNQAEAYAGNARSYLTGTLGERFTWWFGPASTSSGNTIKAHFAAIADAFATKPITVDCGCKKTYYAYVYQNQPYTIYVCKAFWSAPLAGTDSRGGTLIHEMSHFTVVAGTDDFAYGQTAAHSLALSDPTKAIGNADSHEYFAENTPARK